MFNKIEVEAPLGGTILDLKVKVGNEVKVNDVLCVLEAMKMENEICSDVEGIVKEIKVCTGEIVGANQTLMTIEGK